MPRPATTPDRSLQIESVQLRLVDNGRDGLIAWASCVVAQAIKLDNLAIRRGSDGQLFVTYPAKKTPTGSKYYHFNPISAEASEAIRSALIARLAEIAKPRYRDSSD